MINVAQYTELIIVVVLSVFVPSVIAQKFFRPVVAVDIEEEEALGAEDVSVIHHPPTPARHKA